MVPADNAVETTGFLVLQGYLFLLVSRLPEFVDAGQKLHLVLISAAVATLFSGLTLGFMNALRNPIGISLAMFSAWLVFELPFSSWKGGSFHALLDTWLKSYLTYVIVVALIANLEQLRKALVCVAAGTAVIVCVALKTGVSDVADDRLYLGAGTLANSNDLATQLLIGLPFLIYVGLDRRRSKVIRALALLIVPILMYLVLKTGSRAALIAAAGLAVIFFFRTTAKNRAKIAFIGVLGVIAIPFLLPRALLERYSTILTGTNVSAQKSEVARSAAESGADRLELIVHSFVLTAEHPLFGVGLQQFAPSSADLSIRRGEAPMWHPVHSFLLLVMAETGIPGLIFYSAALFFCIRALVAASRTSQRRKEPTLAAELSEPLFYSFVGFVTCMFFSPSAYLFHFPLMAALITSLAQHANEPRVMESRVPQRPLAPSINLRRRPLPQGQAAQ